MNLFETLKTKFFNRYTFEKNGVKYFYRRFALNDRPLEYLLNELIAYEMAKKLEIDCVRPIVVNKPNNVGIATKSFEKDGYSVINGQTILENYYKHLYSNNNEDDLEFNETITKMNNLENIWDALDYYFKDYEKNKKNEIIKNIMFDLTKIFSFDIIMMQSDRHAENWEILESNNKDAAYLVPLYDNELCFDNYSISTNLNVEFEEETLINAHYNLKKFLSYSSDDFINVFLNYFEKSTPEVLEHIIKDIDEKYKGLFRYTYKEEVMKKYKENYKMLKEVLEELNLIESSNRSI